MPGLKLFKKIPNCSDVKMFDHIQSVIISKELSLLKQRILGHFVHPELNILLQPMISWKANPFNFPRI